MADLSFKVWHVAVRCDHPSHKRDKLIHPERGGDPADHYSVEPDMTKEGYRAEMRADGWIFHRDGRVTCPECANLDPAQTTPGESPNDRG